MPPMRHFDSDRFSAAATRVIRRAWGLARLRGLESVPSGSFWDALLQEDGVAREWLEQSGLRHPDPIRLDHVPALPPVRMLDEGPRAAVAEAERLARELGRHTIVGSEHLLYGLLATDAERAAEMAAAGLPLDEVKRRLLAESGFTTEPVKADVVLDDSTPAADDGPVALRIVDASLNRVAEGLRAVEDFTRFGLNDGRLSEDCKRLRHDLVPAQRRLSLEDRATVRDVPGDVGTDITVPTERTRGTPADTALANVRRVCESLRSAEEYAKTQDGEVASMLEAIRYRAYDLERRLVRRLETHRRLEDVRLYLLLGVHDLPLSYDRIAEAALSGGVDAIQLRDKQAGDRELLDAAVRLRDLTRRSNALLFVNDRPDIAVMADADGVHVGQDDLPVGAARKVVGSRRLVGLSTHSVEQAVEAASLGADLIGVGPTFPSETKSFETFPGLDLVHAVAESPTPPAFAIGGVTPENVSRVVDAGLRRVAVSRAVTHADVPEKAARMLAAAVRGDASPEQ